MANKLGIDPKMFKHIHTDDKSTTLQHRDGHVLTIAHNILNPTMQTQLKALANAPKDPEKNAKGGSIPHEMPPTFTASGMPTPMANGGQANSQSSDDGGVLATVKKYIAPVFDTQDQQTSTDLRDVNIYNHKLYQPPENKAKGGAVKMAEGGTAGLPCLNPSCKSHGKPHPNCRCYGSSMADGGEVEHVCSTNRKHDPDCEYFKGGEARKMYANTDQPVSQDDNAPIKDDQDPTSNAQAVLNDPNATPEQIKSQIARLDDSQQAQPQQDQQPAQQDETPQTEQNETSPSSQSAQDAGKPMIIKAQNPVFTPRTYKEMIRQDLDNEDQAFQKDLQDGHITPKTYSQLMGNNGTLGKIGSLFALMLGGAGSGLAHQSNAFLDMMNNTIANDLDAR